MAASPQTLAPPVEENASVPKRKELTPYMRGKIVGAAAAGASIASLAQEFNLSRSTIRVTLSRDSLRTDGESRARTGRPKSYTDRDVRNLIRHVQTHPTDTYAQMRRALGTGHSSRIMKDILKANGITHWHAKSQKQKGQDTTPTKPASPTD